MRSSAGVPDVVLIVSDGLGNQLFGLAAAHTALDRLRGTALEVLVVDERDGTPLLEAMTGVIVRRPGRRDRLRWVTVSTIPGPLSPVMPLAARWRSRRDGRISVRPGSPFDAAPVVRPGQRLEMRGYFQHPTWFEPSWGRVADLLIERAPPWYPEAVAQGRTVVHVRRGDYVGHGWELSADYYRRAIEAVGAAGHDIVLVTDEPRFLPWIEAVLRPFGCTVSLGSQASDDTHDFWSMAAAGRLVMSNSTFAWWAAACATRRSSSTPVVCPDPWLAWPRPPAAVAAFALAGWRLVPSGIAAEARDVSPAPAWPGTPRTRSS